MHLKLNVMQLRIAVVLKNAYPMKQRISTTTGSKFVYWYHDDISLYKSPMVGFADSLNSEVRYLLVLNRSCVGHSSTNKYLSYLVLGYCLELPK